MKKKADVAETIYVSVAGMRSRGWTRAMVDKILGEPDKFAVNPRYKSAAPTRLYSERRIKRAEKTKGFKESHVAAKARSARAIVRADQKVASLQEEAAKHAFAVDILDPQKLLRRSIASFNDKLSYREDVGYAEPADETSDLSFLARIQVNYIRHHLSDYDNTIDCWSRRPGALRVITTLRKNCYCAIARAYPQFADECNRQLSSRQAAAADLAAFRESNRHLGSPT